MLNDLRVVEIAEILVEYSQPTQAYACLVVAILTHGSPSGLRAHDGKYKLKHVLEVFKGDVCPSLIGRPKIFFIQACQGRERDYGALIPFPSQSDVQNIAPTPLTNVVQDLDDQEAADWTRALVPVAQDFIVVLSSVIGYISYRHEEHGALFIDELCNSLIQYVNHKDLLTILLHTNKNIEERDIRTKKDNRIKKQTCMTCSTLTKNIIFF